MGGAGGSGGSGIPCLGSTGPALPLFVFWLERLRVCGGENVDCPRRGFVL
jgi:hypothetical protein